MLYYEKLRELRGDAPQEDIARAVGVSKSAWAMYESGRRRPRDEVKLRIAQFFNTPVQDIFFGDIEHI